VPVNEHGQPVGDPLSDWRRRPLPAPVHLHGRHVRLEPLGPEHAAALLAHVAGSGDDPLWTYRGTERPEDRAAMDSLVAADRGDTSTLTFAVVLLESGQAHGIASYARVDPAAGSLEVAGVLFSHALQRTPASTEVTHLLLRHAFDALGYRRVEWKCDSLNEPSRRAALRLGLTYEGRFRSHLTTKGRNRDTDWFALVDADWPEVRAAHERWLDPGNFGQAGEQRMSLGTLIRPDAS
jgi:RimJ/RimL family protein N-acetyltransferase